MKQSKYTEEVTIIGEGINQNNIRINSDKMDKVIMMLSQNLYSNPIGSFLREIVSNAWDSHKEAGNMEQPVVVNVEHSVSSPDKFFDVSIRDYGTGISPERFDEVFRFMGTSTKDDSNEYIGSFGIGKLSPLAVSEMVSIESFYEGLQYSYVMYKNGMSISIDLISVLETTEKNGVKVTVQINQKDRVELFNEIRNQLLFFSNVYLVCNTVNPIFEKIFNKSKIYEYESFKVLKTDFSGYETPKEGILIGDVFYPIDKFSSKFRPFHDQISSDIVPKFNIGELEVTPTRETLLFSNKVNTNLEKRFLEVRKEVESLKRASLKGRTLLNLMSDKTLSLYNLNIEDKSFKIEEYRGNVDLWGKEFSLFAVIKFIRTFCSFYVPTKNFGEGRELVFDKFTSKISLKFKDLIEGTSLFNIDVSSLSRIEKLFIRSTEVSGFFLSNWGEFSNSISFRKFLLRSLGDLDKNLVRGLYKEIKLGVKKAKTIDFSLISEEFISENKIVRSRIPKVDRSIAVRTTYNGRRTLMTEREITDLTKNNEVILYTIGDTPKVARLMKEVKTIYLSEKHRDSLLEKGIGITEKTFLDKYKKEYISNKKMYDKVLFDIYPNILLLNDLLSKGLLPKEYIDLMVKLNDPTYYIICRIMDVLEIKRLEVNPKLNEKLQVISEVIDGVTSHGENTDEFIKILLKAKKMMSNGVVKL